MFLDVVVVIVFFFSEVQLLVSKGVFPIVSLTRLGRGLKWVWRSAGSLCTAAPAPPLKKIYTGNRLAFPVSLFMSQGILKFCYTTYIRGGYI